MRISYDKLWHLMKINKMKKGDLAKAAEITEYTMSKLNKEEAVSLDVMVKLCRIFHCNIGDLVDIIEESNDF